MCTVVQGRSGSRMRETQQLMPSGLLYSGFRDQHMLVLHPMTVQPGSSQTEHILSRYRPIAPRPVAGTPGPDHTTVTANTHSVSSLSTDTASTTTKSSTEYRPGKRSRKRPPDYRAPSASWKKARGGAAKPHPPGTVELHPHAAGYSLTPLFPVRVAQKFGPGGLQRFHDSFDHRPPVDVSVSLSLSAAGAGTKAASPPADINLGLYTGARGITEAEDVGFMDRAALFSCSPDNEICSWNPSWRSIQPRDGRPSLSTSFGTDSEVCSAEINNPDVHHDIPDIVTLSLLPDTPSNVNYHNTRSASPTSTLSLLRWLPTSETPATTKTTTTSDWTTSLTMSSTTRWSDDTETPVGLFWERIAALDAAVASTGDDSDGAAQVVVDAHDLDQRHGGSSEAVMLTDGRDQLLWANSAFERLSNETMSANRIQAMGPHIDPLGIRTQLAILTFQPPSPAPKCKAALWGFLKKINPARSNGGPRMNVTP